MSTVVDVLVIGAGQSGLAMGWHLKRSAASFAILDASPQVGHSWSNRWDSLRLFTPARYDGLPGMPFPGDPDHHPGKDEVAQYLRDYATAFELPIRLGTAARRLSREGDRFVVETPEQTFEASQVVVATGAFQDPAVPRLATAISDDVVQMHSSEYRNPAGLPDGQVMVVGSGNSGLQIAGEVAVTRPVTLALGEKAQMLPQTVLGRDIFWWLTKTCLITKPADSRLARRMRARGELVIGTRIADLAMNGVDLAQRVTAASGNLVRTADGREFAPAAIIWATGYRPDWSWIDLANVVTQGAGIKHDRGVTSVPGLYFLGLPWQHSRGSALLGFVQEDAQFIAARMHEGSDTRTMRRTTREGAR